MSRKVYKYKELDILERWGYTHIASVASTYYATTYYKVRAINDLRMCGGVAKACPAVIATDGGVNWSNTVMTRDISETINMLLSIEGAVDGLEKV